MQRRPPNRIPRIHICPQVRQHLDGLHLAGLGGDVERRVAVKVGPADGRAVLNELLDDGDVTPQRGDVHGGRRAKAVHVEVGLVL